MRICHWDKGRYKKDWKLLNGCGVSTLYRLYLTLWVWYGPSYHSLDSNKGPFRDLGEKDLEEEVDEDLEEELARLAHIPLIRPPLGPAGSHGPHTSSSPTSSSSSTPSSSTSSFSLSSSSSSSSPLPSSPPPLPCCSRCKSGGGRN